MTSVKTIQEISRCIPRWAEEGETLDMWLERADQWAMRMFNAMEVEIEFYQLANRYLGFTADELKQAAILANV